METLLINGNNVRKLLTIEECIAAVEEAFRLRAVGKAESPSILGVHAKDGAFHIKAGIMDLGREYFVSKTNANFPQNKKRNGLPTIQGVIVVSDAQDGRLLALTDSIEVTIIRTGAATAVAAKYLSRPDADTVTIIGCGNQGRISIKALRAARNIRKVYLYDVEQKTAQELARELQRDSSIAVESVSDFKNALTLSDIIVTCTPAKKYFISKGDVKAGTFLAAVGSDNEEKQELDPELLEESVVVVDSIEQASKIGELHHAIDAGLLTHNDVFAELGEIIAGIKPFKYSNDQTVIFDSTGTALQDVAASAIVYEKALETITPKFSFNDQPTPGSYAIGTAISVPIQFVTHLGMFKF
jgi:ornithine cyclodeaminase/alanine dehydrogenase-like protein (mu-crystallin family)